MAGSVSTQARMKIERRVSLETGNVTAEPVRNRRRPPSVWEASSKAPSRSTGVLALACGQRRGVVTRETRDGGGERPQPEAREGQTGSPRVTERSVVASKRVMIVERRGLSSRATLEVKREDSDWP
jgi:hypothetical protein